MLATHLDFLSTYLNLPLPTHSEREDGESEIMESTGRVFIS